MKTSKTRLVETGIGVLDRIVAGRVLQRIVREVTGMETTAGLDMDGLTWNISGRYGFFTVKTNGQIVYDDYRAPIKGYKFQQLFTDYYQEELAADSLTSMGFMVERKKMADETLLMGVSW